MSSPQHIYFDFPRPHPSQNNSEVIPFFLAGLCHPVAGVKSLTARTLVALGVKQDGGRRERCRMLLQPPLLPAIVAVLGDSDTGAAQVNSQSLLFDGPVVALSRLSE